MVGESLKDLGMFSLVKKMIAEGSRKESIEKADLSSVSSQNAGRRMADVRKGKKILIVH